MDILKNTLDLKTGIICGIFCIGLVANIYKNDSMIQLENEKTKADLEKKITAVEDYNSKQDIFIKEHSELLEKHSDQIKINEMTSAGNAFQISNILKSQK